jgi:hypothetical protein
MKYLDRFLAKHRPAAADPKESAPPHAGSPTKPTKPPAGSALQRGTGSSSPLAKPTKPDAIAPAGGFVGFVGDPPAGMAESVWSPPDPADVADDPEAGPARFMPPASTDPADRAWQAELANADESRREAWDERAAVMQHDGGLTREEAERRAAQGLFGFADLPEWIKKAR